MSNQVRNKQQPIVLCVEDNYANLQLVRRLLTAEGFVVLGAATHQSVLSCLYENTPDLILMDLNMPHMDGYAMTIQIRALEAFQQVPIIALTANVLPAERDRSLAAGCNGFIQKPIDIDQFPEQLRAFLVKSGQAAA